MSSEHKVVIIDDEPLARDIVKKFLEDYPEMALCAECDNGFDGLKAIHEQRPDIVFLDIQMPKLTGFEMLELLAGDSTQGVLRNLGEYRPVIIFTTAYDQYALKAFEVSATDYLLKPFSKERFREALEKARIFLKDRSAQTVQIDRLVEHHDRRVEFLERIVVKTGSKITVIPVERLVRLEAQDDYVMLYTTGGKFLKQKTMKYFETHLNPQHFVRIHRSHLVKISRIQQLEPLGKSSYRVKLNDSAELPVSKKGYQKLKEVMK